MSDNKNQNQQVEELDINHLMQVRREKLKELQEQGKVYQQKNTIFNNEFHIHFIV